MSTVFTCMVCIIAVGEVLCLSKYNSQSVCSDAHTPLQVGVGVPGGSEAIVHVVT